MDNKNLIGFNVKQIRKAKNLSQKEVIARLHLQKVKIDEPMLSRIENCKRPVSDFEVFAISQALETDINNLFKKRKNW